MTLNAPIVTGASDGVLDYFEIQNGVQLEIPYNNNSSRGDMIIIHWGNEFTIEHVLMSTDELPLIFDVVNNFPPSCLYDGEHIVHYEQMDEAGNISASPDVSVTVKTTFN